MASEQNGRGLATSPSLSKRCPKCGVVIDCLITYFEGIGMYKVMLEKEEHEDFSHLDYFLEDFDSYDSAVVIYLCQACEEDLFSYEEDAIAFLQENAK